MGGPGDARGADLLCGQGGKDRRSVAKVGARLRPIGRTNSTGAEGGSVYVAVSAGGPCALG